MNLRPLLTIWNRPGETLTYLKNETKISYAIGIFAIAALASAGYQVGSAGLFGSLPLSVIIAISLVITFAGSLVSWIVSSALYYWIGKGLFKGVGTFSEMLRVVPGATIPMIWMAPINFAVVAVYGKSAFEVPPADSLAISSLPLTIYFLTSFLTLAVGIYSIVISSKGIGIVHRFSAWRGFGVMLLVMAAAVVLSALVVLVVGIALFTMIA